MAEFFQFVIGGLAIGSVYGLVALGFVLIFKSTDVFNFAQGDLLMVGGYLLFTMVATLHLPMIPAILAVLAAGAVIGVLLQAVVFRSMIGRPLLTVVMVTIALSLVIRSVMQIVYGTQERTLPHTLPNDSFGVPGRADLDARPDRDGHHAAVRGGVRAVLQALEARPADAGDGRERRGRRC